MIYEKKVQQIEFEKRTEPKLDLSILKKRSSGKTASGIILGYMKKFKNLGNVEMTVLFQEIYKQIKALETSEIFRQEKWKGKSGIKFVEYPNKVICICYQKFEKGEKPKEIKTEITKEEINRVIKCINKLTKQGTIETKELAEMVYMKPWGTIFFSRNLHFKLVKILNYLEYKNLITYHRSGKIKAIKESLNFW